MESDLVLTLLSEWSVSSGRGDSFRADSVLLRDSDGFPTIPGTSLRGLLRDGARCIGMCRQDLANAEGFFWGTRHDEVDSNRVGRLLVSTAYFPKDLKDQVRGLPNAAELIDDLTVLRAQTTLTHDGIAKPKSLRTREIGIAGVEFEAHLTVPPLPKEMELDDDWLKDYFAAVCAAVKALGISRSRGLGHCEIRLRNYTQRIHLPSVQQTLIDYGNNKDGGRS